jgi:hypothetical protein
LERKATGVVKLKSKLGITFWSSTAKEGVAVLARVGSRRPEEMQLENQVTGELLLLGEPVRARRIEFVRRIFLEDNTDQLVGSDWDDQNAAAIPITNPQVRRWATMWTNKLNMKHTPVVGQASSRYEPEYFRTGFGIFDVESEKEDKQSENDCQSCDANYGQPAENLRQHIVQRIAQS